MATQRKWYRYQDFLDVLDTVKELGFLLYSLFSYELDYELDQVH